MGSRCPTNRPIPRAGAWDATTVVRGGETNLIVRARRDVPGFKAIYDSDAVVRALVTTFVLGLPALVYALLASIWVIRIAQGALLRR